MVERPSIIETGVDKLVKLIKERGRIAISDAAKEVNVSAAVVTEWANFLEEEGIISIEHTLTKPYLVERKLTKKEVDEKAKQFGAQRDAFVSKAEVSLNYLQKQQDYLQKLKGEFETLSKKFSVEMQSVKGELDEMHNIEALKTEVQQKLDAQKKDSQESLGALVSQLTLEEKKLSALLTQASEEETTLVKEEKETQNLRAHEEEITKKIQELKGLLELLERKVTAENNEIDISKEHIQKLHETIEKVRAEIEQDKKAVMPLLKKSEEHSQSIRKLQETIIQKLSANDKKLANAKSLAGELDTVFQKRVGAMDLFSTMNKLSNELTEEFTGLIKKARAFQLASRAKNTDKTIMELEDKFEEIERKKNVFDDMYQKLMTVLKSK